MQNIHVISMNI